MMVNRKIEELIVEAKKQVDDNPTAEQVIVLVTAKNNMYTCINHCIMDGNYDDENHFFQMLVNKADVEVKYLVCMWNNGGLEIPSANFRKQLLEICSKNTDAIYCGQGADGIVLRRIV